MLYVLSFDACSDSNGHEVIFLLQYADKNALGQSAVLGLLYVRSLCLPHALLIYAQPGRTSHTEPVQPARDNILCLLPRRRVPAELRSAALPRRQSARGEHLPVGGTAVVPCCGEEFCSACNCEDVSGVDGERNYAGVYCCDGYVLYEG